MFTIIAMLSGESYGSMYIVFLNKSIIDLLAIFIFKSLFYRFMYAYCLVHMVTAHGALLSLGLCKKKNFYILYIDEDLMTENHYNDVMMGAMASQISSLTIVYSSVCSRAAQRKYQSSASLAFVRGVHRWPVNSPHKGPVTPKMFPFDDVIINFVITIAHHTTETNYYHIISYLLVWETCHPIFNLLHLT